MRSYLILLAFCVGLMLSISCGGDVGAECNVVGSGNDCRSGRVCTLTASIDFELNVIPVNVCLRECTQSTDCGDGEVCRILICTDPPDEIRSCQTGPVEFPEDFDPCAPQEPEEPAEPQ